MANSKKIRSNYPLNSAMIQVTSVSCSTNLKISEMVLGYLYHAPKFNFI